MATNDSGRVTTRELYKLILGQNETRAQQHLEVIEKIHAVELRLPQIKTNEYEIKKLRNRSNFLDGANALLLVIAGYFGFKG